MNEKIIIGQAGDTQLQMDLDRLFIDGMLIQGITGTRKSSFVGSILKQIKSKEDVQLIIFEKDKQFKVLRKFFPIVWISDGGEIMPVMSYARSMGKKVRETGASVIVDLSAFPFWSERQKFVGEFIMGVLDVQDEIYSKKCLIISDESQLLFPQGKKSYAKDPMSELAETGRKYGIRPIMLTQRISEIEKSISAQLSTRIIGRAVEDLDRTRASYLLTGSKTALFNDIWKLKDGEFYARGNAVSNDLVKFNSINDDSLKGWNSKELFPLNEQGQRWVKEIRAGLTDVEPENELETLKMQLQQKEYLIDDLKKEIRKARNEGYQDAIKAMEKIVKS